VRNRRKESKKKKIRGASITTYHCIVYCELRAYMYFHLATYSVPFKPPQMFFYARSHKMRFQQMQKHNDRIESRVKFRSEIEILWARQMRCIGKS